MEKKPVDGYKKPGFWSKHFKKEETIPPVKSGVLQGFVPNEEEQMRGLIAASENKKNNPKEEPDEIIELAGDVCAPVEEPKKKKNKITKKDRAAIRGKMVLDEDDED